MKFRRSQRSSASHGFSVSTDPITLERNFLVRRLVQSKGGRKFKAKKKFFKSRTNFHARIIHGISSPSDTDTIQLTFINDHETIWSKRRIVVWGPKNSWNSLKKRKKISFDLDKRRNGSPCSMHICTWLWRCLNSSMTLAKKFHKNVNEFLVQITQLIGNASIEIFVFGSDAGQNHQ